MARFPSDITGGFDPIFWDDKLTLQVMGESTPDLTMPSPQQLGLPGPSTPQYIPKKATGTPSVSTVGKQKQPKDGFKRVVFLAYYEGKEIIKTHTAHLKLRAQDCNVHDVAKLVKEYLNIDEDLVIVDSHGYELMDNEATRGK